MTAADVTSAPPPVWFGVPDTFTPLDLDEAPASRATLLLNRTALLTGDQRVHLVLAQEVLVDSLRRAGAVYAATVLGTVVGERPRLSVAQFSVIVTPLRVGGDVVMDAIAARLEAPGLQRVVDVLDLPVGRALAVIEDRRFTSAMSPWGKPRQQTHTVRQLQLMVPFPDRRFLAVFALATECLRDWETYVDILGDVAGTITFSEPGSRRPVEPAAPVSRIAAALDGRTSVPEH